MPWFLGWFNVSGRLVAQKYPKDKGDVVGGMHRTPLAEHQLNEAEFEQEKSIDHLKLLYPAPKP